MDAIHYRRPEDPSQQRYTAKLHERREFVVEYRLCPRRSTYIERFCLSSYIFIRTKLHLITLTLIVKMYLIGCEIRNEY